MSAITLDPQLRSRLNNLSEALELRDADSSIVARVLPEEEYRRMQRDLALSACPYPEDELQRLRKQRDGTSLEEFWKRQGVAS
jgi:hypothetical protein